MLYRLRFKCQVFWGKVPNKRTFFSLNAKYGVIEPSIPVCSEPALPNKIFLHKLFIFYYITMISSFRRDMLNWLVLRHFWGNILMQCSWTCAIISTQRAF